MSNPLGNVIVPAAERFKKYVSLGSNGCMEWTGGLNGVGYGQFYGGRSSLTQTGKVYAHRWAYEQANGPIPDGMSLDHLCRNRKCVNPSHLEPVSPRENVLRGVSPAARHSKKTHCPKGHSYSGKNLRVTNGSRFCRECARIAAKVARDKARLERN